MKEDKYEVFDVQLMEEIAYGANTFNALSVKMKDAAKPFASAPGEEWRVVDRRLTALKKMGHVSSSRSGNVWTYKIHI